MSDSSIIGTDQRIGYIRSQGGRVIPIQYVAVDGLAIFEGCIILGTIDEMEAVAVQIRANPLLLDPGVSTLGLGVKDPRFRWPGRRVPYTIESALPSQERVIDAIKYWEDNTAIRFPPRQLSDRNWVTFKPGQGCASSVGMQGGQQFIILGEGCSTGNTIHEIGHTIGLWHEQSRSDRDQYVEVLWANIHPAAQFNFNQHVDDGILLGTYDLESIMHYGPKAFSISGGDTIRVRNGSGIQMGQRTHFSAGDLDAICQLYP
jgi:hypothetical protein